MKIQTVNRIPNPIINKCLNILFDEIYWNCQQALFLIIIFHWNMFYQVQYIITIHICTYIDKTGTNIDCKNCSFTANLYFWGHLNLTVANNLFYIPRIKKKTLILFNMFFGVTRFYSLDNISIGTPPRTTSASFHP